MNILLALIGGIFVGTFLSIIIFRFIQIIIGKIICWRSDLIYRRTLEAYKAVYPLDDDEKMYSRSWEMVRQAKWSRDYDRKYFEDKAWLKSVDKIKERMLKNNGN